MTSLPLRVTQSLADTIEDGWYSGVPIELFMIIMYKKSQWESLRYDRSENEESRYNKILSCDDDMGRSYCSVFFFNFQYCSDVYMICPHSRSRSAPASCSWNPLWSGALPFRSSIVDPPPPHVRVCVGRPRRRVQSSHRPSARPARPRWDRAAASYIR